jgi:hypothetical protein
MKTELKELAHQIKEKKKLRKNKELAPNGYVSGLDSLRNKFRYKHVAYCLVRGRTLEQCDSGDGLDMEAVKWVMRTMSPESKEKLYVVVNEKLSPSQQAVQAGHAVAEFLRKNQNTQWSNGHLIYLKASPWSDGSMYTSSLQYGLNEHAYFVEPDIGNKVTAYAIFCPYAERQFQNFKLV